MHFAHTYRIYACTCVCTCGFDVCMRTWICVTLAPWQRECSGFNKRVGVAHPVITVIVEQSSTSLCTAGNHEGQDLTSMLHTPSVQHNAYFNTRLCSNTLDSTHCHFYVSLLLFLSVFFKCLWWSTCLSSIPAAFCDAFVQAVHMLSI